MPLYMVERRYADQVDPTNEKIRLIEEVNTEEGVSWLYSFLSADQLLMYCLYEAPSPEAIRIAAHRADLPADVIVEVSQVNADSLRRNAS